MRAFRAGASVMGNSELAERTNLSAATVSRLTQTLVKTGMLDYDEFERAYRLSAAMLSLGHAVAYGSPVLRFASPLIQRAAKKHGVNIGLATRDLDEMVYLSVEHFNRKTVYRNVTPGHRVSIELTSLGRAYLSAMAPGERDVLLQSLGRKHPDRWDSISAEISQAIEMVRAKGYCTVPSWQPGVLALAVPIRFRRYSTHVVNVSIALAGATGDMPAELVDEILALAGAIEAAEGSR